MTRVLVVDDDATTRRLLARILQPNGFECCLAANGDEGVRMAMEVDPDVIVMDVVMPVLGGLDALVRLRADARTLCTPVVFLTGSDDAELHAECHAAGAACLVKPAVPEELVSRVRRALADSERSRQSGTLAVFSGAGSRLGLMAAGPWPRCA